MTRGNLPTRLAFAPALLATIALSACTSTSISGTVELLGGTLPTTGTPLVVTLSGEESATANVSSTGAFEFKGIKDGNYILSATVPSTVEGTQTAKSTISSANPAAVVTIAFNATGSVSGIVTATLNPTGGVPVTVVDTNLVTTTASDGSFSFSGVPVGSYWLSVSVPKYDPRVTEPFIVTYNANTTLPNTDVEMDLAEGGGAIRGSVQVGTTPAVGASVTGSAGMTMSDVNGNFSFPLLCEGYYTVIVTVPNTVEGSKTVQNIAVNEDDVTDIGTVTFTAM